MSYHWPVRCSISVDEYTHTQYIQGRFYQKRFLQYLHYQEFERDARQIHLEFINLKE